MDPKDTEVKRIVKAVVDEVHLVSKPAIGRRFCLVKSADADSEPVEIPDEKTQLLKSLTDCMAAGTLTADEVREILQKSPRPANDMVDPPLDDGDGGRQEVIDNVRCLVQKCQKMPVDLRKHVVQIAKYHGVEAPEVELSPGAEMAPVMAKLEVIVSTLQQVLVAQSAASQPATPLKKEEDKVVVPATPPKAKAPVALVKSAETHSQNVASLQDIIADLKKSLLTACGKDPDSEL